MYLYNSATQAWARPGVTIPINPGAERPYYEQADWLWDPIPASPVLHTNSATWVGYLNTGGPSQHVANLDSYGNAIVYPTEIDGGTPRYTIPLDESTQEGGSWGSSPFVGHSIPVPVAAQSRVRPFTGSNDSWLIVADPTNGQVYHIWQARFSAGAWRGTWGGIEPIDGDGVTAGGTASGLSNFAGTIRAADITDAAGAGTGLGFALQFASDAVRGSGIIDSSYFVAPAIKTDGHLYSPTSGITTPIPEGVRVQLNPSVDVEALSVTAAEKVLARTLQTHGAYVCDNGGARMSFAFERMANGSLTPYSALGLTFDYFGLSLPWDQLRVLKNWHGGA